MGILIEKHKNLNKVIIIDSDSNHYNACLSGLEDLLNQEIYDFERDNVVKKRKIDVELIALKELIEKGLYVFAYEKLNCYKLDIVMPKRKSQPIASFSTLKENGVASLFEEAEDWSKDLLNQLNSTHETNL